MILWEVERLFRFTCKTCGHVWEVKHWAGWYSINKKQQPIECPHCHLKEIPVEVKRDILLPL